MNANGNIIILQVFCTWSIISAFDTVEFTFYFDMMMVLKSRRLVAVVSTAASQHEGLSNQTLT